jgi:ribosomal protein L14E/L6E/L27E
MSDAVLGRVVYSAAGRDRKRPFVIVGVGDDGTVLIADGKLRVVSKPKRKNLRHLIIKDAVFGGPASDDAAIREFLRSYEDKAR